MGKLFLRQSIQKLIADCIFSSSKQCRCSPHGDLLFCPVTNTFPSRFCPGVKSEEADSCATHAMPGKAILAQGQAEGLKSASVVHLCER